jgi:hypothetical protein
MVSPETKKLSRWVVPVIAATVTVFALEVAQRVSVWAAVALAAATVIGGLIYLAVRR